MLVKTKHNNKLMNKMTQTLGWFSMLDGGLIHKFSQDPESSLQIMVLSLQTDDGGITCKTPLTTQMNSKWISVNAKHQRQKRIEKGGAKPLKMFCCHFECRTKRRQLSSCSFPDSVPKLK